MNDLFDGHGIFGKGLLHLSPKESHELCAKGAVLVDVREEYLNAFKKFDVMKVIYIPMSEFNNRLAELPVDAHLIIADSAGLRSKDAAQLLMEQGYKRIANMAGGIIEWERDGLPLVIDTYEQLTGSCMCQLKTRKKRR
jgi:rhodanese-related sulfurtransferase